MTIRELPPEEWDRLVAYSTSVGIPIPPPEVARAIVAEDEGQIVGWWLLSTPVHVDGVYLDPTVRSKGLIPRMWNEIKGILDDLRVPAAFCCSDSSVIDDYVMRLGFQPCPGVKLFVHLSEDQPCKPSLS